MNSPPPPTPSHHGRGNFLNKLPFFSRAQQAVILLLGVALLILWAWRGNFGLSPNPPPARTLSPVFVEVTGTVARPGVYSFPHPPTLLEVWRSAGATAPPPEGEAKLRSGLRLEITKEGRYQLSQMSGSQLLTLGLALDLNKATREDLEALPDIGPVMAERIINFRQSHGPFRRIEDLEQVSGIGPKKLEKIKPYLVLGGQEIQPPDLHE